MANRWHAYPAMTEAAEAAGQATEQHLRSHLAEHQTASLAISGGSSPTPMFRYLAQCGLPWERIHLFWVDERGVPPDHEQSNYRVANEVLVQPAGIPAANVHRIEAERPARDAAEQYAASIMRHFGLQPGGQPEFTVIHLGMGPDAHTASLFPGLREIEEQGGLVAAPFVPKLNQFRITLLPSPILAAKETVFLAGGADKAEILHSVFYGEYQPLQYPSQFVVHHGRSVTWYLDQAAAKLLR